MGLLALKVAGLLVGSAALIYVHIWMPRTVRAGLWVIVLLLLLDDGWDLVQLTRLAGWLL